MWAVLQDPVGTNKSCSHRSKSESRATAGLTCPDSLLVHQAPLKQSRQTSVDSGSGGRRGHQTVDLWIQENLQNSEIRDSNSVSDRGSHSPIVPLQFQNEKNSFFSFPSYPCLDLKGMLWKNPCGKTFSKMFNVFLCLNEGKCWSLSRHDGTGCTVSTLAAQELLGWGPKASA